MPWNTPLGRGLSRGCMKRIVVSFDDETFEVIRQRAATHRTSFAEQVRQLVEWGLEDVQCAADPH